MESSESPGKAAAPVEGLHPPAAQAPGMQEVPPQARRPEEVRCAVVRHAERADACFSDRWNASPDALEFPQDPPVTRGGRKKAREVGLRLKQLEPAEGWGTVISSPFLRCVQTALEICKATGAPLLIDGDWGEVRFSDLLEFGTGQRGLTRSPSNLARLVRSEGVELANPDAPAEPDALDDPERPDWSTETIAEARERYARKFRGSLTAARLSGTSFIVVSHGESLPTCLQFFGDSRDMEVFATPYCASIVGRLDISSAEDGANPWPLAPGVGEQQGGSGSDGGRGSGSGSGGGSPVIDGLLVIETTVEVHSRSSTWKAGKRASGFQAPASAPPLLRVDALADLTPPPDSPDSAGSARWLRASASGSGTSQGPFTGDRNGPVKMLPPRSSTEDTGGSTSRPAKGGKHLVAKHILSGMASGASQTRAAPFFGELHSTQTPTPGFYDSTGVPMPRSACGASSGPHTSTTARLSGPFDSGTGRSGVPGAAGASAPACGADPGNFDLTSVVENSLFQKRRIRKAEGRNPEGILPIRKAASAENACALGGDDPSVLT